MHNPGTGWKFSFDDIHELNNMSLNAMSENIPYIERLVNLNALLANKSHFLLGPRQTGKTFLIRHALDNVRVYDLLDSEIYLALSRNPARISEEIQAHDRIVLIDEIQRLPELLKELYRFAVEAAAPGLQMPIL